MTLPKRTPEEWVTIAAVAKELRIVFCEGPSDAAFVQTAAGFPDLADFRSAEEIEFDPTPHQFRGSNRLRVEELANHAGREATPNLRCLVDRDFDVITGENIESFNLLYTTGANMIASGLQFDFLRQFLRTGFQIAFSERDWCTLRDDLKFCFICRYINQVDDLYSQAPDVAAYQRAANGWAEFDRISYVQAFFGLQGLPAQALIDRVMAMGAELSDDDRLYMNSRDILSMIWGGLRESGAIRRTFGADSFKASFQAALPADFECCDSVKVLANWAGSRG